MTTAAPSRAYCTASSRPSPGPMPVITATLFSRSMPVSLSRVCLGRWRLDELDGGAVGVVDVEAAEAGARDVDDRGRPVLAGRGDGRVLRRDVDHVDAQVRIADVVVAGGRRIVAGRVVLHELDREAVELEHGDLDLGALVPSERVEPRTAELVRAGLKGESG